MPIYDFTFAQFLILTLQLMVSISTTQLETQPYICKVNQVIDGNTIICNNEVKVRLWGIKAPKIQPAVSKEEAKENNGLKARDFLKSNIKRKKLVCKYKEMNKVGIAAQCFKDLNDKESDIAYQLLNKGYATEDKDVTNGYYSNPNPPSCH